MEKQVVEFFAGIGLMQLGLVRDGWQVCYANDISADKENLYTANFGSDHFLRADIHALDAKTIPTASLVTASFPCTDLSLAGGRAGLQGKESSAFWGLIRLLTEMRDQKRLPPLVLLENVTGFLTSHQGADLRSALQALNRLGYAVDMVILDAAWFVPQSRQRLFVVGVQREYLEKTPSSLPLTSTIRPKALVDFILQNQDISWSISPLPNPPERTLALPDILEDLPQEHPDWWSQERVDYLLNQMSERHRSLVESQKQAANWSYGTAFRRMRNGRSMAELRTDGIAGCLRTPKGGSARQILVRYGFGRCDARLLSGRECARLMGTPDTFQLDVPLNQALFAFGDAVCVPVVTWLSTHYLTPLYQEITQN
jgi:DNA (cytosine-5)-methyltransferase 1